MKEESIKGIEQDKKGRRSKLVALRGEDKEGGIEGRNPDEKGSGGTSSGKQGGGLYKEPLRAFASANKIPSWVWLQVVIPLVVIAIPAGHAYLMQRIPDPFGYFIGRGVLLTFSGLLLLGVCRFVDQAKSFTMCFGIDIGLEGWKYGIMCLGIIAFILYGQNCSDVSQDISHKMAYLQRIWAYIGLCWCIIAVTYSLFAMWRVRRVLERFSL
jgi:hypothetical protein